MTSAEAETTNARGSWTYVTARSSAMALVAALALGCGSDEQAGAGPVVRDNAGVAIIVSNHSEWNESEGWEISAAPLLEIGVAEGDSLYQFFRVTGVRRLSDGRIVVANLGTSQLRFYDTDGRFLKAVGGRGGGPGEFRSLSRLEVVEDSLLAVDYVLNRVQVFTSDGNYVRAVALNAYNLGLSMIMGVFADGSMLLEAGTTEDAQFVAGVNETNTTYYSIDASGTSVDTVGRFFSAEHYVEPQGDGYTSFGMPFGRSSATAVADSSFYYADGSAVSIAQYSARGELTRIFRHPTAPVGVTAADRDRVIEYLDEDVLRQLRNTFRKMPLPASMPAVGALLVDSKGNIWVGKYRSRFLGAARCWWIFAAAGQLLGSRCFPQGFTVHQIGSNFILGVSTDGLGVERVTLYGLIR